MNLLKELQRRNVIRMAGLYLVGAWLVTQVASTILPMFEAPSWLARSIVILLAIGFIPALIVSWVFELTPEGLKRDGDVPITDSIAPQTAKKLNRLIVSGLVLVICLMAAERLLQSLNGSAQTTVADAGVVAPINSIAVLAFQNKDSDADTEYLSDGLAESLIYRLAQLPNLKVSPTSSIFRYKGKDIDPVKIGAELGVSAVMSGRLVQRGDDLSISVELLDVRNGNLLWGEQYNRKMSELLATQREMVTEIVGKLQLKLSGESEQKLAKKYTNNDEAYQLYLKGRFHFAKRTKEDTMKGIDYYQQAIKLDPNFALAYAAIAEAYNAIPSYPYLSPGESISQAKAAAKRALEIDPNLSEAHSALGTNLGTYDWNWAEAEREHKRAIELSPNSSIPHFRYGQYLSLLGRKDESIAEVKRAVELEPLSLITGATLAATYLFAGQNEKGLEQAQKVYDLEPNFVSGRFFLGLAYNANGMYAEAIALSERSLQTDPQSQLMLFAAGYAYAKSGRRQEAEEIVKRFREIEKTQYVMSTFVASIYGALGDKDKAFAELEKAFENRDFELCRLKVAPYWDPIRDDPRYNNLLKRMGLPEELATP